MNFLAFAISLAIGAFPGSELLEKHRKWLEEEVVYIITERERDAFRKLESVEEREAFIEAFWRKRDPDPLTPVNEFKEEHYQRIEHANRVLGRETPIPGWMTDRGKMYIILGEPRDREAFQAAPGIYPAEVWFYEANPKQGLSSPFYLLFFQQGFAGEYRLYSPRLHGPEKLFPALQFGENSRMEAYQLLQNISPDLAHASVTFRADEGAIPGIVQESLSTDILLAEIYRSPQRAVDTSYVDAIDRGRGVVESEYLFNYVPSFGMASIIPGPEGASFVHWGVELEPQHLTLMHDPDKKKYYTAFDIRGEVTTADGRTLVQFSREEYLEISPGQFGDVRHRPFAYRSMFPLVGGAYQMRVVLKNRARTEYTIFESPLVAPEPGEVFLGEPVLVHEARKEEPRASPVHRAYQVEGLRLDPNARRVYLVGSSLMVYVPLAGASPDDRLLLRLTSQDNPSLSLPSRSARVGDYAASAALESLSLEGLAGGHYRLDVELQDPRGERIQSRSADFDVSPRSSLPRPWAMVRESLNTEAPGQVKVALADQYLRLGRMREARPLYEKALTENPELGTVRLVLARLLLDDGRPDRAIETLEPLLKPESESAELLVTLGDAYYQTKGYARAAELFEKALSLRRPDVSLLNALAACHAALGNPERARAYLEQSLAIEPEQEAARLLLRKLQNVSKP